MIDHLQSLLDLGHTHLIFSVRMSAWWGAGSIYTSDIIRAKSYTNDEAVKFCKKHVAVGGGLGCVPVSIATLIEVLKK